MNSPPSLGPLPSPLRHSLVDQAAGVLRDHIAQGRWPVGEKIPIEPELAELMGVSRGTVRAAVRSLAVCGLLDVRQGAGTYVRATRDPGEELRRMRRAGLRDQFEVRCGLEVEAARLAALRADAQQIDEMRALLTRRGNWSGAEGERAGFVDSDFAFHLAIVRASGNQALLETYLFFSHAVNETIASTLEADIFEPDWRAHSALIDAIASGSASVADAAVRAFMAPIFTSLEDARR